MGGTVFALQSKVNWIRYFVAVGKFESNVFNKGGFSALFNLIENPDTPEDLRASQQGNQFCSSF